MTTHDMKLISALADLPICGSIIFYRCPSWYQLLNVTLQTAQASILESKSGLTDYIQPHVKFKYSFPQLFVVVIVHSLNKYLRSPSSVPFPSPEHCDAAVNKIDNISVLDSNWGEKQISTMW